MTKDEALRLALEALECLKRDFDADQFEWEISDVAITAIKAALAQPEQEPVAWMSPSWIDPDTRGWQSDSFESIPIEGWLPIYITPPQRTEPVCPECKAGVLYECVACSSNNYPPQREWVGLTDEERKEIWWSCEQQTPTTFVKAIEQALKEKNV